MVAELQPVMNGGALIGRRNMGGGGGLGGGGGVGVGHRSSSGYGGRQLPRWLQVATYSQTHHHHHIMPTPLPSTDPEEVAGSKSWDPVGLLSRPNPHHHHYMQHQPPLHQQRHQLGPVDRKSSKRDQYIEPQGMVYVLKDEELVEEGAEDMEEEGKVVMEEMEMAVDVPKAMLDPGWDNWKTQETLKSSTTLVVSKATKDVKGDGGQKSSKELKGTSKHQRRESAERDSLSGSPRPAEGNGGKGEAASKSAAPASPRSSGAGKGAAEGEEGVGAVGGGRKSCTGLSLKTFLGVLSGSMGHQFGEMAEKKEPFWHLWILLSSFYGILIVVLMMVFCVTEVMDNSVPLLSFQGAYLMYLYVGSIAVIICIYIWVLIDSCSSLSSTQSSRSLHLHYPPESELPSATTLGIDHGSKHISMSAADGDISDPELNSGVRWRDAEMGTLSRRFGSLKKAHISRSATSTTSFYLRVGALAFGLGTLVYNGLEMAMHSMMDGPCLSDVVFVHPVLNGLFTFLQMHFLFVNSQVVVERFGLAARFGFMHLVGTNLALWVRLIVWETGLEWTYFIHLAQGGSLDDYSTNSYDSGSASPTPRMLPTPLELRGFPRSMTSRVTRDILSPMTALLVEEKKNNTGLFSGDGYHPLSESHIDQVVALHRCLNTNSLGQLWTSSMPFLFPFLVEFSLIAAAVMFVMAQKVGQGQKLAAEIKCKTGLGLSNGSSSKRTTDCHGASKGLFLGLLCLVSGIVITIVFFVVKDNEQFSPLLAFWLCSGTRISLLALCTLLTFVGLVQIRRLSLVTACARHRGPLPTLDRILQHTSLTGIVLYSIFGMVAGGSKLLEGDARHVSVFVSGALLLVQAAAQSALLSEALHRICVSRLQLMLRPGRQVITFLLFANSILWVFDAFVTHSWAAQEVQLHFYGLLVWGVVSRISLPLLVFYRFHSVVLLLEVWKRSYGTSGIY